MLDEAEARANSHLNKLYKIKVKGDSKLLTPIKEFPSPVKQEN